MDMTNEELDFTKIHRNMVKYTKLAGKGKGLTGEQFLEFYNAYCELYDLLCEYMNAYNRLEEENQELKKQIQFRVDYCNKLEEELFGKSKVTEQELKDMIIGMLE